MDKKKPIAIVTFCGLLALVYVKNAVARKPNTLQMMIYLAMTGEAGKNGHGCRIGSDIAINEVNKRNDYLPDYHIEAVYRDEGSQATLAPRALVEFKRDAVLLTNSTTVFQSPVVIGPWFTAGCVGIAAFLQHVDSVGVSPGCGTPQVTARRKVYPNLYRIRASAELLALPQLHVLREIGKWNRIGIFVYALSTYDVALGTKLLQEAVKQNFDISVFDFVLDYDMAVIETIKRTDTRVIAIECSTGLMILKLLCLAYTNGITGPRYSFIAFQVSIPEPSTLSKTVMPGCDRDAVYEQLKYSLLVTPSSIPAPEMPTTSLGYNDATFETVYNNLTGHKILPDNERRIPCHDGILQGIVALHKAEERFRTMNMSLKAYSTNPRFVANVINETMTSIEYTALRLPKFKYSARVEFDDDYYICSQWTNETGMTLLALFGVYPGNSSFEYSGYFMRTFSSPVWFTSNGKPPRDKWILIEIVQQVPVGFFSFVIAFAIILGLLQLASLFKIIRLGSIDLLNSYVFTTGCLFFNAAAVLFAAHVATNSLICIAQRILAVIAFGAVDSFFFCRMVFHYRNRKSRKVNRGSQNTLTGASAAASQGSHDSQPGSKKLSTIKQTRNSRNSQSSSTARSSIPSTAMKLSIPQPGSQQIALSIENKKKMEKTVFISELGFLAASGIYLTVWMCLYSPSSQLNISKDKIHYDSYEDALYLTKVYECRGGDSDLAWVGAVAGFHAALLCFSSFLTYQLRHCKRANRYDDFLLIRIAIVITTTLFLGAILIIVILRNPIQQMITMSVFMLIFSSVASGVVFVPQILKKRPN